MTCHIAQYNIAKLIAPLDDPRIAGFIAALDPINKMGDESPGFVWRHQTADGNSTSIRVRGDPLTVINFSVWESIEAMFEYTYHSAHADIFRRRREFFEPSALPQLALWWTPAGREPSVEEAEERLNYLQQNGPSAYAFGFKSRFPRATSLESPRLPGKPMLLMARPIGQRRRQLPVAALRAGTALREPAPSWPWPANAATKPFPDRNRGPMLLRGASFSLLWEVRASIGRLGTTDTEKRHLLFLDPALELRR